MQVREIEPIASALVATVKRCAGRVVARGGGTLILADDVLPIVVEGDAWACAATWFEAAARHEAASDDGSAARLQ